MAFSVIRSARSMVGPAEETPSGMLDLSFMDKLSGVQHGVRSLHVYSHGHEPAKIIREALSRALVPYYPLAGRLKKSSNGDTQVSCTAEGVWFVEASSNCSLAAVNYFDNNFSTILHHELIPDHPPESDGLDLPIRMQVTQFTCGGFVIGLVLSHTTCDGLGSAQFLKAVGEFARGLQQPSIVPVWSREVIPTPARLLAQASTKQKLLPEPPLSLPDHKLESISIDISLDRISQLKREFQQSTGQTCTTFELIVASIWSSRTRAVNFHCDTNVTLMYLANGRQLCNPPLPEGFYGNCFFPVSIKASSKTVSLASNAEVVKLVQEGKYRQKEQFRKWMDGIFSEPGENPYDPSVAYRKLVVSEWGRLGFSQVNFGWGPPVHMIPVDGSSIVPLVIIGTPPTPKKGFRLMTWCVKGTHMPHLVEEMKHLA
ncbi:PREDICTED: 10-deacetylbaccatin III 10-O-acetyltransferase-like [Nelumbo nucifera]|uniref:10-deacetylbaccatin III 10-O-acetyltransferase-like n=2 Tax=Nelumbo nucifera TaxID=4432 RepID=A0A1U7ZZ48_NELNU|nr:PREDICTED: 10-deacetylbaccatin III 10-O-acetyltransferase-like [Nelumbo nucifera]DAD27696.1 TPA_asm: hypothetical protein HUJ06_029164 [Nelumbo nucifera]